MDNSDLHPIDQWKVDAEEAQKAFNKQALLDSSLVFQVFSTPVGQQLLSKWVDLLISSPSAHAGDDLLKIGMNEGYKQFIRVILQAMKTHEAQQ